MIIKSIKIPKEQIDKTYFFSDGHLNHDRPWILNPRGFNTIQEHDKWITDQLYTLPPDAILINLGDFTLASSVEYTRNVLASIQAKHYYAAYGNHESFMSKIYRQEIANIYPHMDGNTAIYPFECNFGNGPLIFMGESSLYNIDGYDVYCRHMAPLIWDKMKYHTAICLCGHSHGNLEHARVTATEPKILDVGVDNAKRYNGTCFFPWKDIKQIMGRKSVKSYDHH